MARNALLAAPAVLIIAAGSGPSLNGGLGSLDGTQAALVATAAVAAILAVGVAQLWSDTRRLKRELERLTAAQAPPGLPRGAPAPEFALTPVRGSVSSLSELLGKSRRAVLVFVSTSCGPCLQMLPMLARWQESLADNLALTAVFSGEREAIDRLCKEHDLSAALAQESDEVFGLYALRATPSAVLIDTDGTIAGAPAEGVPAIEALIRSALAQSEPRQLVVHLG